MVDGAGTLGCDGVIVDAKDEGAERFYLAYGFVTIPGGCTSVVYRIASRAPDPRAVWTQFQNEYRVLMGRELDMTKEPDGLGADELRGMNPFAKGADERERLGATDLVQDRLTRLVRLALEKEEIAMSRAAEILRLNLNGMRALANSWVAL